MIVKIMSKEDIENYKPYKDFKYLVFSFYTLQKPKLHNSFIDRIVRFYHIDAHDVLYEESDEYKYFSKEHAREILFLTSIYKDYVNCIICQCDMGISRSSALAMSLCKFLNIDFTWIDGSFKYCPNTRIIDIMADVMEEEFKISFDFKFD